MHRIRRRLLIKTRVVYYTFRRAQACVTAGPHLRQTLYRMTYKGASESMLYTSASE